METNEASGESNIDEMPQFGVGIVVREFDGSIWGASLPRLLGEFDENVLETDVDEKRLGTLRPFDANRA